MPRNIEKLCALYRSQAEIFFTNFDKNMLGYDKNIQELYEKNQSAFDFLRDFLFSEKEVINTREIEENLEKLKHFRKTLLHHQVDVAEKKSWSGAKELEPRVHEIIGIVERLYVPLRQMKESQSRVIILNPAVQT